MDREYSGWTLRYHIDIKVVMDSSLNSKDLSFLGFDILSFAWDESDIRYNPGGFEFQQDLGV